MLEAPETKEKHFPATTTTIFRNLFSNRTWENFWVPPAVEWRSPRSLGTNHVSLEILTTSSTPPIQERVLPKVQLFFDVRGLKEIIGYRFANRRAGREFAGFRITFHRNWVLTSTLATWRLATSWSSAKYKTRARLPMLGGPSGSVARWDRFAKIKKLLTRLPRPVKMSTLLLSGLTLVEWRLVRSLTNQYDKGG